jgi:3'(2'), 5'-bisphosphate nucleotidase
MFAEEAPRAQPVILERVTTPDLCAGEHPATSPESDTELASRLATEAGVLLMELRHDLHRQDMPRWDVMDHGDAASHRFIADELRAHRPHDAVLDEEGVEDPRRFEADRVWIIDPLDGTREYGEGRHDWAVHVALWDRDHFIAGAVALPAIDRVLTTDPAPVVPAVDRERPRIVTSRTRAPYSAVVVANALGAEPVRLGSAGAKAMAVVLGDADIYLHDGGMYQWDSAAPAAVAIAAGLHVSRVDGSPLVYNERSEWLPDFLVCRQELRDPVLDALWR